MGSNITLEQLKNLEPFTAYLKSKFSDKRFLYAGIFEDDSGIWIKVLEGKNINYFRFENVKASFTIEKED